MRFIMGEYKESYTIILNNMYPISEDEEINNINNKLKQQRLNELDELAEKVKNLIRNDINKRYDTSLFKCLVESTKKHLIK